MRLGELQKLDWPDVNLNQSAVFLRDTKNGSPRSVPLSNEARAVIEAMLLFKIEKVSFLKINVIFNMKSLQKMSPIRYN
jgi:integrase